MKALRVRLEEAWHNPPWKKPRPYGVIIAKNAAVANRYILEHGLRGEMWKYCPPGSLVGINQFVGRRQCLIVMDGIENAGIILQVMRQTGMSVAAVPSSTFPEGWLR